MTYRLLAAPTFIWAWFGFSRGYWKIAYRAERERQRERIFG